MKRIILLTILTFVYLSAMSQKQDSTLLLLKSLKKAHDETQRSFEEVTNRFDRLTSHHTILEERLSKLESSVSGIKPDVVQQSVGVRGYAVLVFGIVILCGIFLILKRKNQGLGVVTTKLTGITIVVSVSAFLVVSHASERELAVIAGLFGTIIGYLLATKDKDD